MLLSRERDAGFRALRLSVLVPKAQLTTAENPSRIDLRLMLNADRYIGAKLARVRFVSKTGRIMRRQHTLPLSGMTGQTD